MKIPAPENLLDSIVLSEPAVTRWRQVASYAAARNKIKPDEVSDEDAEVLPDGSLRIFCNDIDGNLITEMTISPDQWAWSKTGVN